MTNETELFAQEQRAALPQGQALPQARPVSGPRTVRFTTVILAVSNHEYS